MGFGVCPARALQGREHDLDPQSRESRRIPVPAPLRLWPLRLIYIPSKLFVHGNATATASNIVAPDCLFSINRPYARRGEFEQMPVRISKIEAPAAQFPCPLLFHGDASRLEP